MYGPTPPSRLKLSATYRLRVLSEGNYSDQRRSAAGAMATDTTSHYRGKCRHKAVGDIQYVLKCAETNIVSTDLVLKTVEANIKSEMAALIDQKKVLHMSLARTQLGWASTGAEMMARSECAQMLQEKIDCISEVIKSMIAINGTIGAMATDDEKVPTEKKYNEKQIDEKQMDATWEHVDHPGALETKITLLEQQVARLQGGPAAADIGIEVVDPPTATGSATK